MGQKEDMERLQAAIEAPDFDGSAADGVEMLAALGGQVLIAGRAMPAPSAGVVALLDALESPFVSPDGSGEASCLDVFRALWAIGAGKGACLRVFGLMRRRRALEALEGLEGAAGLLETRAAALADEEAALDAEATEYASGLGCFSPAEAAREIGDYLAMATGISMLPCAEEDKKKAAAASTS